MIASLERDIWKRKEISAGNFASVEDGTSPDPPGSVHVRRSDPAGIAMRISKTDCVGGRASDLWCNANLSEFYSPPLPLPLSLSPSSLLLFSFSHCPRSREGDSSGNNTRRRNEVETTTARILPDSSKRKKKHDFS